MLKQKDPDIFPEKNAHFMLNGAIGLLEVMTSAVQDPKGVAIICHPHPLHEGAMTNKVVHTLARVYADRQLHTVRFNFRGVGQSEGTFANTVGEVEDLLAIMHWVTSVTSLPIWLGGFSFGAYIAAQGAHLNSNIQHLLTIAPVVTEYVFEELKSIKCPWLIVAAEKDEIIPLSAIEKWKTDNENHFPQLELMVIPQASHFFHGKLSLLRGVIEPYLAS